MRISRLVPLILLHHACGIPVFGRGVTTEERTATHMEVAKRVLQWRWLIIDEISTAGLLLLGLLEKHMRKACANQIIHANGILFPCKKNHN